MFDFVNYGSETLLTFLLVLLRASGLIIMAPVFSHNSVPKMVRVGLLIILAGIIVSAIKHPVIPEIFSLWQLAGLVAKEILVGFVIGLTFRFLFMGLKTGGAILGYQLGLAMVSLPDVDASGQVSIIARYWVLLATLIFLAIDGHHAVISSLVDSYRAIPVGQVSLDISVGEMILRYSVYVFVIAIKVAAPILVTLFLVDMSLGCVSKMIPSMNIFFIGFPIKMGVGLAVVGLSLPLFAHLVQGFVGALDGELDVLFATWGEV
ncbi:MAG: flagellar biosynthetic protein FliR [candidate division Zixibacteria bacterium]|nr:flagellar biosynthetic protein FliR [candidate division Zixibacteria bacterium]